MRTLTTADREQQTMRCTKSKRDERVCGKENGHPAAAAVDRPPPPANSNIMQQWSLSIRDSRARHREHDGVESGQGCGDAERYGTHSHTSD